MSQGGYFLTLCCTYRGEWGSKNLLSDITTKSLMVITHNKTRKSVLPIFYNLSVNMQMRHSLIPDVLPIMPITWTYLRVKRSDRLTFYSYFKKRVGQTNNYIGSCVYLPHNQSYTQKNIGYISPYPRLGEHLLKWAYLCV